MQTRFTPDQLDNPVIAEIDAILRKCVHCGFCTATCPTYVLLGDELDSPRGRIYLIKEMFEEGRPADAATVRHIDRCLSCLACTTTCPASVDYMHLVDHARAHIHKTYSRSFTDRMMREVLARVMPYPRRFRAALALGRLARPLRSLFRALPGLRPVAAMLDLVPRAGLAPVQALHAGSTPDERPERVILMAGCVHPVLRPDLNEATRRLLARHGVSVVTPQDEGCCGSLVHHMGREDEALAQARRNIDAWSAEIDRGRIDAIIVNISGCGTTVKDYGHMFRGDPAYAEKAARVAALTRDITEFLAQIGLRQPVRETGLKVAYHAACSLQHGQKVTAEPKALLAAAGFDVLDIPEGRLCCGSAGTYNMLQAGLADALRARKSANIRALAPDLVAAGNLGCMTQIAAGLDIPVVHTLELLDWATGGPRPAVLAGLPEVGTRENRREDVSA